MNAKQAQLIPQERIEQLLTLEPMMLLVALSVGAWAFYKFFLRGVTSDRHRTLTGLFSNLAYHLAATELLFLVYISSAYLPDTGLPIDRLVPYLGFLTMLEGCVVFVKISRILLFEYLFISHMRVGVPLLLVNIFTLMLTMILGAWLVREVFNIRLATFVATSAVLSLVLGLALQDTLGNLFAGVALQFDKPYELGDWIEIQSTGHRWVGQVQEVSWRATVLNGFSDELITIPNRVVAQAQVTNYATRIRPIARSQLFRIPFGTDAESVRRILVEAANSVSGIRKDIPPSVLINETAESWVTFKLVYFISDFGSQYLLADRILSESLARLAAEGVALASPRLTVLRENAVQA